MKTMRCEILTPEKVFYRDDAEFIVAPGASGELGILSGHTRLMADLVPGTVRVTKGSESRKFVVSGGFINIEPAGVKIFAPVVRVE
jgi:F-type H+-transporting ATPase subunit epsilon